MSRVLLVTIKLDRRTGTEIVCSETAHGLRKREHAVSIYVQQDGATADSLRADGFEVVTDLKALSSVPEVIQANQTYPLLEAIARFPDVPAISICHDATVWFSEPIDLPSIRRHVAVDFACRDRIANRFPHLSGRIEILHNAVDLDAFQPRAPLPDQPKRALILAKHSSSYLDAVRAACAQLGLELSIAGAVAGDEVDNLPAYFREHDLVFGSARCALEALATGCAVVVLDGRGFAGLVTSEAVSDWRQNNFGARLLSQPTSTELIRAAVGRYDQADAQRVSHFIREHSSLEGYLDRLESMHRDVIAEGAAHPVDRDELIGGIGRSFRSLERALRVHEDLREQAYVRTAADQFATWATSRETKLRAQFHENFLAREAELTTMLDQRLQAREAELRTAFDQRLQVRETELNQQVDIIKAEFAAFRAWAAPRNLPRRILHKVLRQLFAR
jgi:hypothetical protein